MRLVSTGYGPPTGARIPERTSRKSSGDYRQYLIADDEWAASVRRRRIALGLTQGELAEAAGICERGIRDYELGDAHPRDDTRAKIERALERLEEEKRRGVDNNAARA